MNDSELHPIFSKDPEEWMQYVYKKVCVVTDDGLEHVGVVYTVDPVSETFVLANCSEDKMQLDIVLGHAVSSINILSDNTEAYRQQLDGLFRPPAENDMSEIEVKERQATVRAWMLKNRLPVEVTGVRSEFLSIADALIIQPPYAPENCVSTNEIILGKIQGLIKNMPHDQEQW